MVLYGFDSNAILAEMLNNKTKRKQLNATIKLHAYLQARGLNPAMHVMDNKCPQAVKKYLCTNNIRFQLVTPHLHQTNAAKKTIGTFKDHFIAGLCSVDPQFPMHLWCQLLPLATTTLNFLRPSDLNSRLSAEALLNGAFNYNKTPLAPLGTKVLVHGTPAPQNMGTPWGGRLVHWCSPQPLPLPSHVHPIHVQRTNCLYRPVFPAQLCHAKNFIH
jgi:hypothetical protein